MISLLIQKIKNLFRKQDKWIKISDEMPKYYSPVIVARFGKPWFEAWLSWSETSGYIWTGSCGTMKDRVIPMEDSDRWCLYSKFYH